MWGMNLSVGIVGLPNVGKSTLFNALLEKQQAYAANFPFATIEPNIGGVPVPDERLGKLADVVAESEIGVIPSLSRDLLRMQGCAGLRDPSAVPQDYKRRPPIVPATVEFVDIAGLVAGASKGEGLGNKFLAHIREVHLICHVLRFFDDKTVTHVAGEIDPIRDLEIVDTELILADLETLGKQTKPRMNAFKEEIKRYEIINKLITGLGQGQKVDQMIKDPDEIILIRDLQLLTLKPVLYAFNVSESDLSAGKRLNLVNLLFKY